jgi:opacity protein-like surface antigen
MKKVFLVGLVLLAGNVVFAQDTPKFEVSVDYSYMRFVPQNNNIVQSFSLNGGGGALTYNLNSWFGIKGEMQGYLSQTRSFNFSNTPICIDDGARGEGTTSSGVCTGNVQANLFTYNIGPVIKFRSPHVQPFVEALFGGAHSNVDGNLVKDCTGCSFSGSPSNNGFDFTIGGGIDIPITHSIALRPAEVDYVLTRFGNPVSKNNNNQSNFRYQAGVVFSF